MTIYIYSVNEIVLYKNSFYEMFPLVRIFSLAVMHKG